MIVTNKPAKCLDCGIDLPIPRNPATVRCGACQKIHSKKLHKIASDKWHKRNPHSHRKYSEKTNIHRREKRATDPEYLERQRESSRRSRAKAMQDPQVREERKQYQREWRHEHREYINAKNRERFREWRLEALAAYGNKCACCGEDREPFLCIDHVNGGGNKHRKETDGPGGPSYLTYKWLKDHHYPDGFRVLCHNCNMALGFYGYCPHQQS